MGAYNVGAITVNCDPGLSTNKKVFSQPFDTFDQTTLSHSCSKGEEFGMFNTGSTIVLIFEAPKNIQWKVQIGDVLKVGNKIISLE